MKIEIEAVEGDRAQLYQWDLNRRLILTGFGPDTQAHFGQGDSALVVAAYDDGGVLYADIPNICLQRAGMLYVYIYSPANTRTRTAAAFSVWARPKPEDYVYTETDTLTYRKLEAKIGDLENLNTKDKSSLVSAVNEALKTSGGYGAVTYTEQNLTDAQQSQARKNIGALGTEALPGAINDALAQAKESGAFDGAPGKDGSDGKDGAPGANGSDGVTPTIGDNGNWYLGDTDTGKPSRGETGQKGDTGATGPQGQQGEKGDTGATGPAGADGKSAYQYAQEGGYAGTEAEFAAKLAQEVPEKLPNPNALTFTGAVTGTYDGSEPLSVEIPNGGAEGGEEDLPVLQSFTIEGDKTKTIEFTDLAYLTEFELVLRWKWSSVSGNSTVWVCLDPGFGSYSSRVLTISNGIMRGCSAALVIKGKRLSNTLQNIAVVGGLATVSNVNVCSAQITGKTKITYIGLQLTADNVYLVDGTTVVLRGR